MIDIETRNKYGEAILDLAKLTQQGKLQWSRASSGPSSYTEYITMFEAPFDGRVLRLTINVPMSSSPSASVSYQAPLLYPERANLDVLDSGQIAMHFPWVIEMEALVQAVHARLNDQEESIILAIKRAASS